MRAPASWLCTLWGRHEGAQGGRLLPGRGASGVGRSPAPDRSSIGACGWGHYPLAMGAEVRARGPVTNATARALARWLYALLGRQEGTRGGRLLHLCGASGVGHSLRLRPLVLWNVLPGPTTHWLRVWGLRARGPVTNRRKRSCELALRAAGAARGRPGGAPLAWARGVRGRALSQSRPLIFLGPEARTHYPLAVGAEAAGLGTRHQPHIVRPCVQALRAVGATRGSPRGAPLA